MQIFISVSSGSIELKTTLPLSASSVGNQTKSLASKLSKNMITTRTHAESKRMGEEKTNSEWNGYLHGECAQCPDLKHFRSKSIAITYTSIECAVCVRVLVHVRNN